MAVLTAFCLCCSFIITLGLFYRKLLYYSIFPSNCFSCYVFFGSAFLLYSTQLLFNEKKQLVRYHLIVPIIVAMTHIMLLLIMQDRMTVFNIKNQIGFHGIYTIIISISICAYNIVLWGIASFRLLTYRTKFKNNYSNDTIKNILFFY